MSLFDFNLFPTSKQEAEQTSAELDPYAPLSINEGIPMSKQQVHQPSQVAYPHSGHRMMNDGSEGSRNSVPSLSAATYSSRGSSHHTGGAGHNTNNNLYEHHHRSTKPVPATISPNQTLSHSEGHIHDDDEMNQHRFKPFHEEKWSLRYKELLEFHKEHSHSAVPHTYPKNPQLARWVKRQRRQYKLRKDSRASTMTSERLDLLNAVGFVWDSHDVNWREKLDGLATFRRGHAHCNVPSNYKDKKLATWVKCQRRQYKLYWDGKPSAMSPERILELERVGFEWEIRATASRSSAPAQAQTSTPTPMPVASGHEDFHLLYQSMTDM